MEPGYGGLDFTCRHGKTIALQIRVGVDSGTTEGADKCAKVVGSRSGGVIERYNCHVGMRGTVYACLSLSPGLWPINQPGRDAGPDNQHDGY